MYVCQICKEIITNKIFSLIPLNMAFCDRSQSSSNFSITTSASQVLSHNFTFLSNDRERQTAFYNLHVLSFHRFYTYTFLRYFSFALRLALSSFLFFFLSFFLICTIYFRFVRSIVNRLIIMQYDHHNSCRLFLASC